MNKNTKNILLLLILIIISSVVVSGEVFSREEYTARRTKFMEKIPDGAAIIWGAKLQVPYKEHYQNNDFMYFAGLEIPDSILIIDGKKKESILFFSITDRSARNEGISLEVCHNPKEFTGVEKVYAREDFTNYLSRLVSQMEIIYTSFKPEELMRECTNEKYRALQKIMVQEEWDGRLTRELQFIKLLKERFPNILVKDCSKMIWDLRIIKSPAEIKLLRRAAKIAVKAHTELMKSTRPGIHEFELAALFEYMCKKEGAQDMAYYVLICSGENHPFLHYYKHDRMLQDGDFLVIDAGPDLEYYDIDITISYPANGKFTPRQREVYEACNAVHNACMQVYRPGLTREEARKEVDEILLKQGFDLTKDYFKKMRGGFGHYVGMAVHDVGGGPNVLKPGMVIANEPLVVYPEENLGVRVEDTILITEDGCENLTAGIPRKVEEIEAIMKKQGVIQALKKAKLY